MSGGRIAFVNNSDESFTPTVSGAIATCIWECCRAAGVHGERPLVITRDIGAPMYDHGEVRAVRPSRVPRGPALRALRAVRRLTGWYAVGHLNYAHRVRAQIVDAGCTAVVVNNDPELAVYLTERLPGVRVVHWFHNLRVASDRFRRAYAASRVESLAVSRYLARAVEMVYVLTPGSVGVAGNGVDATRFRPVSRSGDLPVIGCGSRIAVEKGQDVLLEACLLLATRGERFGVQLVGDTNWGRSEPGAYRDRVHALLTDLRVAGVPVSALGHVERSEVPACLGATDIHVVPSRWDEPFGLTVAEGMATGLAVVCSAAGGMPEVLGAAGMLVPREDPDALADALQSLLRDPERRRDLGVLARARAEELTWAATWAAVRDRALPR